MKLSRWYLLLAAALLLASSVTYWAEIALFHRTTETIFYMFQDLAFVPVQVLLVTIILNSLLAEREKRAMLRKMNMAIGVFFSEVGTSLLRSFSSYDGAIDEIRPSLLVRPEWNDREFTGAAKSLAQARCDVRATADELHQLKEDLLAKRPFLLGLLENANLLEHDSFTNLLWAVFHLAEELACRTDFNALPESDLAHLRGDVRRAYVALLIEWVIYLRHLKTDYPYIFSLVVRTNPFDPEARAVVD